MNVDEPPARPVAWTIRAATPDDADAVAELRMAMLAELGASIDAHWSEIGDLDGAQRAVAEANRRYASEHLGRDLAVWLAEAEGTAVASGGIVWFAHPPSLGNPAGLEAYVLNVYTRPAWRRLGLARALMTTVLDAAAAAGARRVWLRASDQGRPLYESLGFGPKNYLELGADGS